MIGATRLYKSIVITEDKKHFTILNGSTKKTKYVNKFLTNPLTDPAQATMPSMV